MLRRWGRILLEISVVCISLLAVGLFWASYYVDTDEFRETFSSFLQDFIGRDVELRGEIDIALWPGLILDVEDLSIGEDVEFGEGDFAHFDRIRIRIRLLPLLSERLDISTIFVEGMDLSFIQTTDGVFNWKTILDRQNKKSTSDSFSGTYIKEIILRGVEVANASVTYKDDLDDSGYILSGINLRTGAIESDKNVPFTVSSVFSWIDGGVEANLTLKGMLESGFDGSNIALSDATLCASIGGSFLPKGASPGELTARVVVDWDTRSVALDSLRVRFMGLRAEGNFKSSDLRKGLSAKGHVTVHPFTPADTIARFFPKAPIHSVDGLKSSAFTSFFHINEDGISFNDLALTLDDITVRGQFAFKGYSWPVFSFDLRGNTVDFDRYLPLFKTNTPFIWDDFNLNLFRAFRGKGTVRVDGFKVLDTLVSDIRLSVEADKDGILLDAGAIKKNQALFGGKTKIIIEENDDIPVLSMSASLTAQSQKNGFSFLKTMPLNLGGAGTLGLKAKITQMSCPPMARSIDILRHLEASTSLLLGDGKAQYKSGSEKFLLLDYSKADISFNISPINSENIGYYDYLVTASAKTDGGKGNIEALSLTAQGALTTAIDKVHVKSSGMDIKGRLMSKLLPKKSKRATVTGKVAFDSETADLSVTDTFIRFLDTSIKGTANITGLDKSMMASGRIDISGANPKRIIYLLSDYAVRTKDVEALKKAEISTRFKADKNGFVLSELAGNLDGMLFNGHVVGHGFENPMLDFSFSAGVFDLDRYLSPSPIISIAEMRSGKVKKAPPVSLPLGFLRTLRLNGNGVFKEFKLANIRGKNISATIKADVGKIHIFDVTGKIHDGQLMADLQGEVEKEQLSTNLKLHVDDMQIGPLLKDMAKREYIRGETDVDVDLGSFGATDDDIIKNLSGKAWVRTRNGSFKFTGYNSTSAKVKNNVAMLDKKSRQRPRPRTTFRKAMAYFTVKKGVFVVDKFRVEAPPFLQSSGEGSFSLPDNTINLAIRNDFVAIPSVTIQIVGTLIDPEIKIPTGKILNDTVRNILSLPEKSFKFLRDFFL